MESNNQPETAEHPLLKEVSEHLKSKFDGKFMGAEMHYDFPVFIVAKDQILEIVSSLYNDLGYTYLTTCCGMHFPDHKEREFGMVYQLHNLRQNKRIRLKTFFTGKDTNMPSLTSVFSAANWMEREAYDFFGFTFTGHPNLKRILNMDELVGWPMRKEFPLEDQTREDKDDTMFGRG
jgi:NADH-quinone oxidoreductase subunit C